MLIIKINIGISMSFRFSENVFNNAEPIIVVATANMTIIVEGISI